ncbi:MAG: tetratricopeptide repeat protein [Bacteroidales bacterium]
MKRSVLKPALLLAGVLSIIPVVSVRGQDLNTAIQLTKSESYDKATDMYKALIQKDPGNSLNYFYLGENYLLDYFADTISNSLAVAAKEAKSAYDEGVSAQPNNPLNYVGLAKVAFYLGDDKTADEMRAKAKSFLLPYKNIKKIVPPAKEYAFTLAKLAESYEKDGEVDTTLALPLVRQAITIDPKNPEIYLITGDIYMMINDGSDAIKYYNLAQFADPQSPTAAMKIGYVYMKGRAFPAAIQNFEEAIRLNPNYAPAYRELGQLYWRAGRLDQSKENFKKYLDLTAGNIPAKIKYVNSLFYAGDYDEVIKIVKEILAVDKSRGYMNRLAAYSYFEKKNPDYNKALEYMEELFKTVPPEYLLEKDYHYMARILLKKNQDYPKLADELNSLNTRLDREKLRYSSASAAEKAKLKPALDELSAKVASIQTQVTAADKEIDRAFVEYNKALNFKGPQGSITPSQRRALLSEMASSYYTFRKFNDAAKTWLKIVDPSSPDNLAEYMQIANAYSLAANYKSADSVFNIVLGKSPDYLPAYLRIARNSARMDPDLKQGLAKPKFEKVLQIAQKDSVKNESDIVEALSYLGYLAMKNDNYTLAKEYYQRMLNVNPNSKENKIKAYNGLGYLETSEAGKEKTLEGKLGYLAKAAEDYNKILEIDPNNAQVKSTIKWVQDYQASVKKGINPNEIRGVVTDMAGQPISYASVKVKDTAAEILTNQKGEYKFEIPQESDVLVASAKGYKTVEEPITKSRVYNFKLEKE